MSEILLIRPGCTDYDQQCRLQGTLNLPLNERGEQQVLELVAGLREYPLEAIFVGPNEPALSTAEALGEALGVKVKTSDDWQNLNLGLWQGLPVEELKRKSPKAFKQWSESPETACPPEGEVASAAIERIGKTLKKAIRKRACFGIVAPDPLASLIRCALLCQSPDLTDCLDRSAGEPSRSRPVEVIRCDQWGQAGNCEGTPVALMNSQAFATISRPGESS